MKSYLDILFREEKKITSILLVGIVLFYTFFMTNAAVRRWHVFEQEGDLAAYENAVYNTVEGRVLESTVASAVVKYWPTRAVKKPPYPRVSEHFNLLGIHFMPTLLVTNVIPFLFYPKTQTTLFLQTLAIALTALSLGYLVLFLKLPSVFAVILTVSFLLHPATLGANINAFHPILMCSPFLVWAMFSLEKNQNWLYVIWVLLIFGMKENTPLAIIGLSLFVFFKKGWKFALINFILSTVAFVVITKFAIPYFNPSGSLPYGNVYGSPLGGGMAEIIKNSLLKPVLFLKTVFSGYKNKWLIHLILPVGFLSLFSPSLMIVVGLSLAPNLVSSNKAMASMYGQYNALALPYIYIAAIYGIKKISTLVINRSKLNYAFVASLLLIVTGLTIAVKKNLRSHEFARPLTLLKTAMANIKNKPINNQRVKDLDEVISNLPEGASLAAPEAILTKVHMREKSFIYPVEKTYVDYVIYYKKSLWINEEQQKQYSDEMYSVGYKQVFENDTAIMLKKEQITEEVR